eukprot:7806626-Pyramimonas_sp.AAC.1
MLHQPNMDKTISMDRTLLPILPVYDWDSASDLDSSHSNPLFDDFDEAGSRYPPLPPNPDAGCPYLATSLDIDLSRCSANYPNPEPPSTTPMITHTSSMSPSQDVPERPLKSMLDSSPLGLNGRRASNPSSLMPTLFAKARSQKLMEKSTKHANPLLAVEEGRSKGSSTATEEDIPDLDDEAARRARVERQRK